MRFFAFILKAKTCKHYHITLKITELNGALKFIETPLTILPEEWDDFTESPINIYNRNSKLITKKLNRIKIEVANYFQHLEKTGKSISTSSLRTTIKKICALSPFDFKPESMLFYMYNYIKQQEYILAVSTYRRYFVFLNLFERFEAYRLKNIMLEDIDVDLVREFYEFGRIEKYSENTMSRSINFIRTILNALEKKGVTTSVNQVGSPKKMHEQIAVILSENELFKIQNASVSERLAAAKDWLLISCYTGQRISDFMRFKADMIKEVGGCRCLSFIQQKTKKKILLPLHPVVEEVLNRNSSNFPVKISIEKYNAQIKEIVKMVGINDHILVNIREGHRSSHMSVPKWKAVSSHIGRRSFATNFYGKIPTSLLIEATGHSSEAMFQKYVNRLNEEHIKELSGYFQATHEKSSR